MTSSSVAQPSKAVVADVGRFRSDRAKRPMRPYENLMDEHAPSEAAVIVADGWQLKPFPRVALDVPMRWDELCAANRSWHFHLQSWDPIATVLAAYDARPTPAYLHWALDLALDWAQEFHSPAVASAFAWYDMALGLRAYRLAYLLDVAARESSVTDEQIAWLLSAVELHRQLLADDETFAAHSNHGFYQAAGQLALSKRLDDLNGSEQALSQGATRMRALMERHFSPDGIHLEHSPEYQWLLMQSLARIVGSGLIEAPDVIDLFGRVQESMAWFFAPNNRLVMFGDSTPREPKIRRPDLITDEALTFVASRGKEGRAPAETTRLFAQGGYAVLRDRWPEGSEEYPDCSYLAQTCCFHSRVHKHADDMSFVWYDRRREILTDSGRYGYDGKIQPGSRLFEEGYHYSNPNRVYVESTRAHNCVEIDGRSYPRRRVRFYGSRLLRAGSAGGILYTEAELRHLRSVRHARVLMMLPREWVIVFDWLRDGHGSKHDYVQWLQFAPGLRMRREGPDSLRGVFADGEQLSVAPLLPAALGECATGQEEPLLGWISEDAYAFEPRYTAGYAAPETSSATFATLICLGEHSVTPDHDLSRVNVSGREARLCWSSAETKHELKLSRQEGTPLILAYRSG